MSRKAPSTAEQRLQILEILSSRLDEVKADTDKIASKVENIQLTLSNMSGANLGEQIRENRQIGNEQEKRIRLLETEGTKVEGRVVVIERWIESQLAFMRQVKLMLIGAVITTLMSLGAAIFALLRTKAP